MKSLAELAAIREQMKNKVAIREGSNDVRIVVGMATCGIAAGARPVLNAFVEEINKRGLSDTVTVGQTGCIGLCRYEPIVEVYKDGEKTTYIEMTAEKAYKVVVDHIKGGKVVSEYTLKENA